MGGINDIANAFREAAGPGINLKAVRMKYDNETGEQVYEFDVVDEKGPRTVVDRVGKEMVTTLMGERAAKIAKGEEPSPVLPKAPPAVGEMPPTTKPKMPKIGPQALFDYKMDPQANAGGPYSEAAPEVPSASPFSSQASDTKTDKETSA